MNVPEQAHHYRLDDEQRARVRDCLTKEGLSLPSERFEGFIRVLESSITHFLAAAPEGTFREAHDALRDLWQLSNDDDPPVGIIRSRIQTLPKEAIEYLDRRVRIVVAHLCPTEPPITRFQEWAAGADRDMLIDVTRALSAAGARIVEGRSRGGGKRSRLRMEPVIMGHVRSGTERHRGGRPKNQTQQQFVMHLSTDWLTATGKPPSPGRSDSTGFGDLAHSVFQWLELPQGSAAHAMRRYWAEVKSIKTREPLQNLLKRHDEET
jgi:hypothetical protein